MGATAATGSGAGGGGVSANVGAPLRFIQAAGVGNQQLHMVPVAEVLYFEAADKYVRVIAADGEYLIRTPLRQLMQQLPPDLFWQVQRGVLVRAEAIASVHREDSGKMWLRLRERPEDERLPVGRLYAHLFKAM
jgi:DNA-binding LytR/AlgR family response regulator